MNEQLLGIGWLQTHLCKLLTQGKPTRDYKFVAFPTEFLIRVQERAKKPFLNGQTEIIPLAFLRINKRKI